jgi:hypothetical protein
VHSLIQIKHKICSKNILAFNLCVQYFLPKGERKISFKLVNSSSKEDHIFFAVSDDATRVVLKSKTYINANYIDVCINTNTCLIIFVNCHIGIVSCLARLSTYNYFH